MRSTGREYVLDVCRRENQRVNMHHTVCHAVHDGRKMSMENQGLPVNLIAGEQK